MCGVSEEQADAVWGFGIDLTQASSWMSSLTPNQIPPGSLIVQRMIALSGQRGRTQIPDRVSKPPRASSCPSKSSNRGHSLRIVSSPISRANKGPWRVFR